MMALNRCGICGQSEQWHMEHKPRHVFMPQGADPSLRADSASPPSPTPSAGAPPADPVVRAILVHKGLITHDEISRMTEVMTTAREAGLILVVEPGTITTLSAEQFFKRVAEEVAGDSD